MVWNRKQPVVVVASHTAVCCILLFVVHSDQGTVETLACWRRLQQGVSAGPPSQTCASFITVLQIQPLLFKSSSGCVCGQAPSLLWTPSSLFDSSLFRWSVFTSSTGSPSGTLSHWVMQNIDSLLASHKHDHTFRSAPPCIDCNHFLFQDHCFYHGRVRGHPESWVALSTCSGIR